ncbi:hypothetical protein Amal_03235 [Acetobacter malorum]|uniref:MvaI/BcnI restriction endonuclease domain-containing protein n=1 Tax=Acetobacter malorum TaxID=178901 RepID=A0A177G5H4_9PROT|nr:MvaI/BcnI family restriction endonuclease [Acetobacter malorum]OAG75590.1 hypothetical protein Amal_03235 [Acetobacter malorum]
MIQSLAQLQQLMRHHGAVRVYAKCLPKNNNSKNQVYLGSGFSALNIIPHGDIYNDSDLRGGSKRDRAKAPVRFFWIDETGRYHAPDACLILYPKYPEVRMSGFLKGCSKSPSDLMGYPAVDGRILFFGICGSGDVLGFVVSPDSALAQEFMAHSWEKTGVFSAIPFVEITTEKSTKDILLERLKAIYLQNWIRSQKLGADGVKMPYSARNGGGYTLEAELGITPNGYSEPDFMGWEVKQYGVADFEKFSAKSPVTLMTPEPTGGLYKEKGVENFLRAYGYADQSGKANRINFGGIYTCQRPFHNMTGLRMVLDGYDGENSKIIDMQGGIVLLDQKDTVAASWSFSGIMAHWNRKHAQAAYIPSLFRNPPPEYAYGARILLCEETDFLLFLKALSAGIVYYDPAVKMEQADTVRPVIKRRSQFRVKHPQVTELYHRDEIKNLIEK